jgi:hypothetical protein
MSRLSGYVRLWFDRDRRIEASGFSCGLLIGRKGHCNGVGYGACGDRQMDEIARVKGDSLGSGWTLDLNDVEERCAFGRELGVNWGRKY